MKKQKQTKNQGGGNTSTRRPAEMWEDEDALSVQTQTESKTAISAAPVLRAAAAGGPVSLRCGALGAETPRARRSGHAVVLTSLPEDTVSFTARSPALIKGLLFPSEKILGQKKKSKRGEERVLCCRKNLQSQTVLCRPGGEMGPLPRLYLGSSITPLLRSVILGYLTFFWSSSF